MYFSINFRINVTLSQIPIVLTKEIPSSLPAAVKYVRSLVFGRPWFEPEPVIMTKQIN